MTENSEGRVIPIFREEYEYFLSLKSLLAEKEKKIGELKEKK